MDLEKDYFLSIGAGDHQIGLIHAAQNLGYRVIAVDRDPNAPGLADADMQLLCSTWKSDKILHLLQESLVVDKIAGVGCRSYGKARESAAIIARHFSLPGPKPESMKAFLDKRLFKQACRHLSIPSAVAYTFPEQIQPEHIQWKNYLPLLVKPIDGHAKEGITILESEKDVFSFFRQEKRLDKFIAEKYIRGKEITVMGFVDDSQFHLICITERFVSQEVPKFVDLRHNYPMILSNEIKEQICSYIQSISSHFQLHFTPIVAEFFYCTEDSNTSLYLIECLPETGGEYLADHLFPAVFRMDYFNYLVKLCVGETLSNNFLQEKEETYRVSICFIPQQDGMLKEIIFPKRLWKHKNFLFAKYLKKTNDQTLHKRGNKDRLAVFGLKFPFSETQYEREIQQIIEETKIEYEP